MKIDHEFAGAPALAPQSLGAVARAEWRWWVPGALFCFLLASLFVSGWPQGLIPQLSAPYGYSGDVLSHSWLIKRVAEGWVLTNPHSGFPFGSDFHDYPGADVGSLLVFKLISFFNSEWQAIFNLYFLGGYAASFVSAFLVLRAARVERPLAAAAAVLFAYLPFHMFRMGHLFYTWYFVAPLFFHCALRSADGQLWTGKLPAKLLTAAGLVAMASFGVYYAAFGVLVLGTVAFAGACLGDGRAFKSAAAACCVVVLGVLLNVAPHLVYKQLHGPNPEVAVRPAADSETFGLKLTQMLMPRYGHRNAKLNHLAEEYHTKMPLVNENFTAALGLAGGAGFLGMLAVALSALAGRRHARTLQLVAMAVLVLFLFGTIGGLGTLFSLTISTSIRGWNRISVFIGFGALMGLVLLLQGGLARVARARYAAATLAGGALLGAFGLWDQGGNGACLPCQTQITEQIKQEKAFVGAIEAALPRGAAVYQLPYMAFPETAPQHKVDIYDLMKGYLHSKDLKWSYAGMKGREGDLFFRSLATQPVERQVDIIRKLGFSGVYLDRGGYADNGNALVAGLTALAGAPVATRADGQVVFFKLPPGPAPLALEGKSARDIVRAAYGGQLDARSLAAGAEFSHEILPPFVAGVRGLSGVEPWGRWSDAGQHPWVELDFIEPLTKRFTLVLTVQPFGPNTGKAMIVRIGKQQHSVTLLPGAQSYRLPVDLGQDSARSIVLVPPQPVSPRELNAGADERKLGIGLVKFAIELQDSNANNDSAAK
ncbi:sugar translocase [Pseudoduganella sp. LjRoot289]|uniref:DUF7024 domain-containing protein n=1 Tax=Pseudoduganella sp. LjRoot289 TaxID=3342314 RepID=UPI003ECF6A43